jgi:hypothetical protein
MRTSVWHRQESTRPRLKHKHVNGLKKDRSFSFSNDFVENSLEFGRFTATLISADRAGRGAEGEGPGTP